ncbi:MAG: hypothetical protein H6827_10660 [Planctomycetes bacterium]|nr:hypothetical protein [Planctomycetota bacterium]
MRSAFHLIIGMFALGGQLLGAAAAAERPPFQAKGTYRTDYFEWRGSTADSGAPKVERTATGSFTIIVKGCLWRIEMHPDGPITSYANGKRAIVTFDGTDIKEWVPAPITSPGQPPGIPLGTIIPGNVPQRLDPRVQAVWLGLASHCVVLPSETEGILPLLGLPPPDPDVPDIERTSRAEWRSSDLFPGFLQEWRQYTPKAAQLSTLLETTDCIDALGMNVPSQFRVTAYAFERPLFSTVCSVEEVSESPGAFVDIALSGKTLVWDKRLIDRRPIDPVANVRTTWPTISDSLVRRKELNTMKEMRERDFPPSWLIQ